MSQRHALSPLVDAPVLAAPTLVLDIAICTLLAVTTVGLMLLAL
jgi:hypothetical protein